MCQPWRVTDGSRKAIIAAFFANLGIAIAKFVGYLITCRPACSPRPRTPSPTPATRGCCCSAANEPGKARPTSSIRSATGASGTSGRSSSPSCCSRWVALFALYEGISKLRHPHETENLCIAVGILAVRDRARVVSRCARPSARAEPRQTARRLVVDVHPHREVAGAARRAARGHRRRDRPVLRPLRRPDRPRSPTTPGGTRVGSIAIGVLLVVIAIVLAIEMKGLLIGESAATEDRGAIVDVLERRRRTCAG